MSMIGVRITYSMIDGVRPIVESEVEDQNLLVEYLSNWVEASEVILNEEEEEGKAEIREEYQINMIFVTGSKEGFCHYNTGTKGLARVLVKEVIRKIKNNEVNWVDCC